MVTMNVGSFAESVCFVLEAVVFGCFLVYFVYFELKNNASSLHTVITNKFVIITFVGGLSLLVNLICWSVYFFQAAEATPQLWIQNLFDLAFAASAAAHITLVYLRSLPVFETSIKYLKIIQVLVISFYVSITLAVILAIVANGMSQTTSPTYITSRVLAMISASLLVLVDVVSTFSFGHYVYQTKYLCHRSKELDQAKTELIASRGAFICICAIVSVTLFWVKMGGYAITDVSGQPQTPHPYLDALVVPQQAFFLTTFVLWMRLKMDLDTINKTPKQVIMSQVHLLKSESLVETTFKLTSKLTGE
eukprot:TRINITY_DN1236_c0_g1_i1.p1 TRINITY_DN1236_c0_g1~~TRINITY_DN1236_c0_g1_i1.p1  ORF type:complete len:306 (-),score=51.70 TRINITY_DN1236_c0_g1_i1:44-961(-)